MKQSFERSIIKNIRRIEIDEIESYMERFLNEKYLLQKTMDVMGFMVCTLDENNCILTYNQATKIFFHHSYKDLTGVPILDICQHYDLKIILDKLLRNRDSVEYVEISIFDNVSRDILLSLYHFEYNDYHESKDYPKEGQEKNINKKVLIISDITDWKNRNLEMYQKKSIDSLSTLTAGVAHEIKNPLAAMDLHLQLIKRFVNNSDLKLEKKLNHWINVVSEELKRLEAIVNDFLYSFRPLQPQKTPENFNELIEEVVDFFQPHCLEKNIDIQLTLDFSMKTFLFDKNQMKQALINLLQNSIEAIQENQDLKDKGMISLVTKENHETVELILTDNGVGISPTKFAEVFKPFFTTKKMGTGLGLSIVSKIIKEHNGEIVLNTDYKEGTQFFLEFSRLPVVHKIKQIAYK